MIVLFSFYGRLSHATKSNNVAAIILTTIGRSILNCCFIMTEIPTGGGAIRSAAMKSGIPAIKFLATIIR